jgi:NAD(P)H-dependent FMN reductase
MGPLRVIGIAGSLRRGSINKSLLRAAKELAPAELQIDIRDLSDLPLYNRTSRRPGPRTPSFGCAMRSEARTACCSRRPSTTTGCRPS